MCQFSGQYSGHHSIRKFTEPIFRPILGVSNIKWHLGPVSGQNRGSFPGRKILLRNMPPRTPHYSSGRPRNKSVKEWLTSLLSSPLGCRKEGRKFKLRVPPRCHCAACLQLNPICHQVRAAAAAAGVLEWGKEGSRSLGRRRKEGRSSHGGQKSNINGQAH